MLANFWDQRYRQEGAIWGTEPSPTARLVHQQARVPSRVLDVGFGYGRDISFLIQQGHQVSGVDLSHVGQSHAQDRFSRENIQPETLMLADYTDQVFPPESFDVIFSHRVAHLLTSEEAIHRFAETTHQLLKPNGMFCLGVRDTRDLEPENMVAVAPNVYEYKHRPGHRIRYWDDSAFENVFGSTFAIQGFERASEPESNERPVPCLLTIMTARKL